jgi:hypothetical protein
MLLCGAGAAAAGTLQRSALERGLLAGELAAGLMHAVAACPCVYVAAVGVALATLPHDALCTCWHGRSARCMLCTWLSACNTSHFV